MRAQAQPTFTPPPGQLHGDAGYPPEWPAIAHAVKAAAGWRCERCGHPDDPGLRAILGARPGRLPCDGRCTHADNGKQRMLTVHHLIPIKALVEPWNLAVLCQACHLTIQGKVIFLRPWFLPHTPWMVPHVRGYNASRADKPGWPPLPLAEDGGAE